MASTYAQERSEPKVPSCRASQIKLTFNGQLLRALGTKSAMVFPAVSGRRDQSGRLNYSSDYQKMPYQGPIPEGEYWIQPSELWQNNWLKSVLRTPRSAWGNFRIAIHPYPGTLTHQRGGFLFMGEPHREVRGALTLPTTWTRLLNNLKKNFKDIWNASFLSPYVIQCIEPGRTIDTPMHCLR